MGLKRISVEPVRFPNSLLFTVEHMSPAWSESSRVVLALSGFPHGAESYQGLDSALAYSNPVTARLGNTFPTGAPLSQLCFQLMSAPPSVNEHCGWKGEKKSLQSTTVALEIDKPRSLFVFHNQELAFCTLNFASTLLILDMG